MTKMSVINCRLAALIVAAMSTYTWAQAPANAPVIKTNYQQIEATVEGVNPATRVLSLRGPSGQTDVVVGDEVKNFNNIHVGDKVIVGYYQGLAVQLAQGDKKAKEPAASTFDYRAAPGQKPGAGAGASITSTVTILAINRDTHEVTFQSHDNSVHSIVVKSPNMVSYLKTLKPGDNVDITYTESLAVNVVPATH
jgi:hypothetical protein